MMNCKQATRLLSDAQERPLSLKEKMALSVHTTLCSACRHFGKQMGVIRHLSRQFAQGEPTEPPANPPKDEPK
ncbi:zf-HC2 domain-containing protein [Shewanella sp. YIC-542]|uniref:zf-HC2 domain-containing protein n=1 Tax=Shewanella mytili TaxID=3377111 RepID=UPI00398F0F39